MDEPDGFRDFVRSRSPMLVRSAWLLTGSEAAAQDLVQAALAAAWLRWDTIVAKDAAEAYVRRVMMSIFLSWRRRRSSGETPSAWFSEAADARDRMVESEMQHDVRAAMAALPRGQRAVLVLRYFADLSEAQTAAALGCSIGTVKSQAHRGLAVLRADPSLRDLLGTKEGRS